MLLKPRRYGRRIAAERVSIGCQVGATYETSFPDSWLEAVRMEQLKYVIRRVTPAGTAFQRVTSLADT